MIVPRSKLLIWVALLVVPFAGIMGIAPDSAVICFAIIGLFGAVALLDAILSIGRAENIQIESAAVTRLSKDREGALELLFKNGTGKASELRVGLPFPRELESK